MAQPQTPAADDGISYPLGQNQDDEQLVGWELEQMCRLGLSGVDAVELCAARVSWHRVQELLRAGCPADTVARILS